MWRHWHNALTAFLGAMIFSLLFVMEGNNCATGAIAQARSARIHQQQREIENLKMARPVSTNNQHADH